VLVVVVLVGAVEVPVVEVSHVVSVLDGDVATIRAVGMIVMFVNPVHGLLPVLLR
jgi:hypothetical protein